MLKKDEYMRIYAKIMKFDKEPLTAEEQTAWIEYHYELEEKQRESLENIAKYSEANSKDTSEVLSGLKDKEVSKDWSGYNELKTAVYDDTKLISTIEQNKPQATVKLDNKQLTDFVVLLTVCICIGMFVMKLVNTLFSAVEN